MKLNFKKYAHLFVLMCVHVRVFVCVCVYDKEKDIQRQRKSVCQLVCVCTYVSVYTCNKPPPLIHLYAQQANSHTYMI